MIGDHDPALIRKIHRIRVKYWRLGQVMFEAGAELSRASKNALLEEAPEIIALFDEYGRDSVLAAVRDSNAAFSKALMKHLGFEDDA